MGVGEGLESVATLFSGHPDLMTGLIRFVPRFVPREHRDQAAVVLKSATARDAKKPGELLEAQEPGFVCFV